MSQPWPACWGNRCKIFHAIRKDGNFIYYRLTDDDVSDLVSKLQAVTQRHLSEVDEVLTRFESHAAEFEQVGLSE